MKFEVDCTMHCVTAMLVLVLILKFFGIIEGSIV